ncbi:MAG TPA: protein kinase [Steroidobacteraceae bacterium]|jgi:serine/threonine protein kinase
MTETEIWTKWESQIVNGAFPLRRFLGRSNHSVVFLTEYRARNLPNAAIKIIPADPALADAQLSRWQRAAALSHPHLIRLLESGRCKLGGHPFLYVVTEYAEQNLAQILPHRALTADEVRELLDPTLDALGFLHGKHLVHGHLKPPNFLVVNDQLKLSSDTLRAAGEPAASVAKPSVYDAPEARIGGIAAAADAWGLGVTLVEALTQHAPSMAKQLDIPLLPATSPPAFADSIRRSLSRNPADRPTIAELRSQLSSAPAAPAAPAAETAAPPMSASSPAQASTPSTPSPAASSSAPARTSEPAQSAAHRTATDLAPPMARWLVPAAAGLVLLALWIGVRSFRAHPNPPPPVAMQSAQQHSASTAQIPAAAPPSASAVLHEEIPAVSRSARASVRGQIKVVIRVTVDRSGNVVAENLEVHGSSKYFARVATDAAKLWKFAPAENQPAREWLVQFEFSRDGTTAHAVPRNKS